MGGRTLLGELEVVRDGQLVPLPASKKSARAVGYLVATAQPQLRERLCGLLWDGPDDPRAGLRWTLSKLRPLLAPHVVAGRERVGFLAEGARVDLDLLRPGIATTEALEQCAALFRGQFVDGLDLPACFRFQQWCIAERERLRQAHVAQAAELTRRQGPTETAVAHARRRMAVDPFSDEAHACLIRLLAELGQAQDALRQYEHCRQMFERELGTKPGPAVEEARRTIGRAAPLSGVTVAPRAEPLIPLVGRRDELAKIASAARIVVVLGEPGIGKTRLLEELRPSRRRQPAVLRGPCFAAELVRPYGAWLDALAGGRDLLPRANGDPTAGSCSTPWWPGRLSVALVALDDVQWLDDGLGRPPHYVARSAPDAAIVCGARPASWRITLPRLRLLRVLARERRLTRVALGPLRADEMSALVQVVAPEADGSRSWPAAEATRCSRSSSRGPLPPTALRPRPCRP